MAELLKFAGEARKSHIKLTNVAYGKDLSKELLALAEAVESLFKDMQAALDAGDEKVLASLLEKAKLKEEEGEKAKAWMSGAHAINIQEFPQAKHYSNYLCNLLFTCGISLKAWMGGAHSMTIQEFPQAKCYYDSLCICFHMSQLRHQFSHSAVYLSRVWHQLSHSSTFRLLPVLCSRSLAKGRGVKRRTRSPKGRSRPRSEVSNHHRWCFRWGPATSANHLSMKAAGFDFTGVQWQVTSICQWLHLQQVC